MGVLARLERGAFRASLTSAAQLQELIDTALGGPASSGISVTPKKASEQPTIGAAIQVLAGTLAILPFSVKRRDEKNIETLRDHPLTALLGPHGQVNEWMTSFEFFELGTRTFSMRGNFYALKDVVNNGRLRALLPIKPERVRVLQDEDFNLTYEVTRHDGQVQRLDRSRVFHVRGPSDDGIAGIDFVQRYREAIGLAIAQDIHAAKVFANGARIAAVLEHPRSLGPDAQKRLRESFQAIYGGVEQSHMTAVLEEGLKWVKAGMTAEEGQLLGSRMLQRSVLAGTLGLPPHMVGDLEKGTFTNIENLARQFVDYGLMQRIRRWETALAQQLLTPLERARGIYVKIDPRALLRGNIKERGDWYTKMIAAQVFNPNEVRELEDYPPYQGGDEYRNPNINPQDDSASDEPETGDDDRDPEGREQAARA